MLTAIGNLLDLPGSMARDAIMLRNPLDQLLDPFSQENRTSGQDVLNNFGLQDSPWLSLALEMGLDPTTYVGYGALSKGAKGLGLVSKGASGAKTVGRAAKALGKAALHPQDTITWLSHMPRRMRGREGEILSGLRAQAENAFAGVKAKFASPVTKAKGALDEAVKAGAAPASKTSLAHELEELFDKTYGTGGEAMKTTSKPMPAPAAQSLATPSSVAEALNAQVADSALSRVRKGFSLSGLADSTIYNPDALRMAMGFMAMNSAAAGRAQNPTSHAYMGYYE